jgi:hypothetical protein
VGHFQMNDVAELIFPGKNITRSGMKELPIAPTIQKTLKNLPIEEVEEEEETIKQIS